jgi:hypothetical protein
LKAHNILVKFIVGVEDFAYASSAGSSDDYSPLRGRLDLLECPRQKKSSLVARCSCHGTHKGDLNGIAPTGKQFNITGVSIARFTNGKMSEGFVNWDALGLMQQLGVVPELGKVKTIAASTSARWP